MTGGATADAYGPGGTGEVGHLPPAWTPTPVRPRLPVGVAFVSVLIGLVGFVMVLAAALFVLNQVLGASVPTSLEIFSAVDLFGALILIVVGAALLAIATSLWRQETWALWTTIVLVFAMTAYLFFTGFITVLFVLFVILLVYLLAVRRYFY
jgi:uncharacterized membrane protein YidH (DUF202 family)